MALDILVVEDEKDIREQICGILTDEGHDVRGSANSDEVLEALAERRPSMMFLDIWLLGSKMDGLELLSLIKERDSSLPVIVISGHGNVETAVSAIKRGALDYIEKPFKAEQLLHTVQRVQESDRLRRENTDLREKMGYGDDLTGSSAAISNIRNILHKVANTTSRIMINGPAGSGKELAARLIHKISDRRDNPFIPVNPVNISPNKIDEALFGVERNTDVICPGYFEMAHGGVLFLDEVSDLPLSTQGRLMQVLTDQNFYRIGGARPVKVNVRIISASTQSLEDEVDQGRLREDLYFRLNVVPIMMPALKDRREDIPDMANLFLKRYCAQQGKKEIFFTQDALAALQAYDWPGNARQLRNVIERTLIMSSGGEIAEISFDMLAPEITAVPDRLKGSGLSGNMMTAPLRQAREDFEREYLKMQIKRFSGNISKTAQFVGMERSALHRKLKALGLTNSNG